MITEILSDIFSYVKADRLLDLMADHNIKIRGTTKNKCFIYFL